ncbi:unnamed protein product [Schistocephalus solidus]|uniref:Uncharacterized protein n=1 Tax=Schistocephalus solidus TaxID=70667 RepID=A0A183SZ05_SCHSO|nr:unnamed protein product [Schistocephalus solidus]
MRKRAQLLVTPIRPLRAGQLSDAEAGAAAGDLVYVYFVPSRLCTSILLLDNVGSYSFRNLLSSAASLVASAPTPLECPAVMEHLQLPRGDGHHHHHHHHNHQQHHYQHHNQRRYSYAPTVDHDPSHQLPWSPPISITPAAATSTITSYSCHQ